MLSSLKLFMLFTDRVGIIADISSLIARKGFNITSMEVGRKDSKASVCLEIETHRPDPDRTKTIQMFGQVPGLLEIRFIDTLPQEARENRFRVVLDNIRDGVISIDTDGRVTTINAVAKRVLNCKGEDITGRNIRDLRLSDDTILECLKGKKFNFRKDVINERGRFQYMSTCRPITDSANRIVGAVEICKDMQEIRELAQSISRPSACSFADFIGKSPAVREAVLFARKIASTDSMVSIRGESGTGKKLFAHAIHEANSQIGKVSDHSEMNLSTVFYPRPLSIRGFCPFGMARYIAICRRFPSAQRVTILIGTQEVSDLLHRRRIQANVPGKEGIRFFAPARSTPAAAAVSSSLSTELPWHV
ncbi:MAG: PAS domain-containing protein [Syntrophobacteraceae bacterium]|nr:PAS domain-containing protein [Desulfobacteraceae bacterium]